MFENKKILVIDDDPGIRESYQSILSPKQSEDIFSEGASLFGDSEHDNRQNHQLQFDLTLAKNGNEALTRIKTIVAEKQHFAVAFIDIKMPGINGAETAKRIWKIDSHIKIVIVTAYSEYTPDDIVNITGRDDIFYLRKPFNPEEIKQFARSLTRQWTLEKERVHLQNELEKTNASLESLVEQRTVELAEAHNKLKKLDQEKLIFLRYLSHEMNTPLNWIGMTQIINREELSNENLEFLDLVGKGFNRLKAFTKTALSYFDLAETDIKLTIEKVSLPSIVSDLINQKRESLKSRQLEIKTNFENLQIIDADSAYLRDVLAILIDNAISFSKPGSQIDIYTETNQNNIKLVVSDNGKGIEKEDLLNIFKPFTIEEFKRREGGYGLNLPKTKLICNIHGWNIRAESKGKENGTKFIIEIE